MNTDVLVRPPRPAGGAVTLRKGAATFAGSVTAAVSGFALAVLVGRFLGPAGAGVFFSIVALFTIASTVLKLGTDTAQLWRLPRLLREGRAAELRPTLAVALVPCVVASVVTAGVLAAVSAPVAQRLSGAAALPDVRTQVLWAAGALAFMAPMSVLVAATRGLGLVRPFVLVQNVGLPVGRLLAVAGVLAAGAGGVGVMAAWSLPVLGAFVVAAALLQREVRRVLRSVEPGPPPRPPRVLIRDFWRFAVPRGVTASIEVALISVNTLAVGLLQGPAAAGVFGALSRFVTSGTLAEQTVRILVAPRFSALLGAKDHLAAMRLYALTTPWVVLVSWPIFVTLAAGAPALLTVFGPGFQAGATALTVLAITMCVSQLAGNVQTVLLMSGHSGLQLVNKTTAVVTLLLLNAVLIPRYGLVGAALAWSASILVDTVMAVVEVRALVGLRMRSAILIKVAVASLVAFGVPTTVLVRLADRGIWGLVVGVLVAGAVYLPVVWRWRRPLRLTNLTSGRSVEDAEDAQTPQRPGSPDA